MVPENTEYSLFATRASTYSAIAAAIVSSLAAVYLNFATASGVVIGAAAAFAVIIVSFSVLLWRALQWRRDQADLPYVAAMILRESAYEEVDVSGDRTVTKKLSESRWRKRLLSPSGGQITLLIGPAASGKTILLRAAVRLACEDLLTNDKRQGRIPIYMNASRWAGEPVSNWIEEEVWKRFQVGRGSLRSWVKAGQVSLVVDALDEAYDVERLSDGIVEWAESNPACGLIVSSRPREAKYLRQWRGDIAILELEQPPQESPEEGDKNFRDGDDSYQIPKSALKILILAALEGERYYLLSEISGLTLLSPGMLGSVLDEMLGEGLIEKAVRDGRRSYRKLSLPGLVR